MLKVLLKKQFTEMFRNFFYDQKKKTARSKAGTVAWIVFFVLLMVFVMGGMFTAVSVSLCGPMTAAGVGWLYFLVMGAIALVLGVFGSVFNTHSALYLAKDNDLLLSMPIPASVIMASRLLGVYLLGLMYSGAVLLPAVIVYIVVAPSVGAVAGGIVLIAVVSAVVMVLSCALGYVVARISLKLKNKSIVTVLLSLAGIGLYYFIYFKAQVIIQTLAENAAVYGEKIKGAAWFVYLFGRVGEGDLLAVAVYVLLSAALLGLTWYILSKSFFKIATASGAVSRTAYREKRAKQASADRALVRREFARFLSSPMYMLNCGLGVLFLPAIGVAMLLRGNLLLQQMGNLIGERPHLVPVLFVAAVCGAAVMNDAAAPAVSLEGKSLWLVKSLPVTPWQALRAKLVPQLVMTLPVAAFCYACGAYVLREHGALILTLGGLTALAYCVLNAFAGLFLGLKRPMLDWTNETYPVKQSMSVTVTLFGGWGYALALGGGYALCSFFVSNAPAVAAVYLAAWLILTVAAALALYRWMKTKGARAFEEL